MLKRLSLHITQRHAAITVDRGDIARETAARTVPQMLKEMNSADRDVLESFCEFVLQQKIKSEPSGDNWIGGNPE